MNHLLLAPHNDDEVLFATFTLLHHSPHVIVCTRDPGDYETREAETAEAMDLLGCDWTQIPVVSRNPDWDEVEVYLNGWNSDPYADQFGDLRVFAPAYEHGGHDQHNIIGLMADRVFGEDNVTHYTTYVRGKGHTQTANEVTFAPEWLGLKMRAIACYRSQMNDPRTQPWFCDLLELREWYA